jgi:hypothetical protein
LKFRRGEKIIFYTIGISICGLFGFFTCCQMFLLLLWTSKCFKADSCHRREGAHVPTLSRAQPGEAKPDGRQRRVVQYHISTLSQPVLLFNKHCAVLTKTTHSRIENSAWPLSCWLELVHSYRCMLGVCLGAEREQPSYSHAKLASFLDVFHVAKNFAKSQTVQASDGGSFSL